ncbi:MAG: hypothetical protein JWP76_5886 [Dactylosporangium sp.]|nr:hypothetical protein [Dactylosporangium sp.]
MSLPLLRAVNVPVLPWTAVTAVDGTQSTLLADRVVATTLAGWPYSGSDGAWSKVISVLNPTRVPESAPTRLTSDTLPVYCLLFWSGNVIVAA